MNIEYYRNFLTIVECGSILAASEKIHIAQPALSHQLKQLEAEFGTPLLERGARRVKLTEPGRIFYQKAKSICDLETDSRTEIANYLAGNDGTLSVALSPTNTRLFVERLFKKYTSLYPRVNLRVVESPAPELPGLVLNGITEIGYIRTPFFNTYEYREFNHYPTQSDHMCVAVPFGHPLYDRESITIQELSWYPMAIPISLVTFLQELSWKTSLNLDIAVTTTSRTLAIELAKLKGIVSVIVVGNNNPLTDETIHVLRIEDDPREITRGFISRKGLILSKVASNFFDCFAEEDAVFAAAWHQKEKHSGAAGH